MNREFFLKKMATMLRSIPSFRGKHRLGKILEKAILPVERWKDTECKVTTKNGDQIQFDILSKMHNGTFWTGDYDTALIRNLKSLFKKDDVVFDIGANVGYYTIAFGRSLYPNGKVFAFEPVAGNFTCLKNNVELNNMQSICSIYKIALGEEGGTIKMSLETKGSTNAYLVKGEFVAQKQVYTENVSIYRLDDWANDNNVNKCDFIKIDVEGSEVFFLKGAEQFIKKHKPIIFGEFNSWFLQKYGLSFMDAWKILEPIGYRCFKQDRVATFRKTIVKYDTCNVLLLPPHVAESELDIIVQ